MVYQIQWPSSLCESHGKMPQSGTTTSLLHGIIHLGRYILQGILQINTLEANIAAAAAVAGATVVNISQPSTFQFQLPRHQIIPLHLEVNLTEMLLPPTRSDVSIVGERSIGLEDVRSETYARESRFVFESLGLGYFGYPIVLYDGRGGCG